MIIYVALFITLALAGYAIFLSFRPRPSARLLSVALAAFVYLYGTWLFLTVWGRYAFGFWMIGSMGMWIATRLAKNFTGIKWRPAHLIATSVLVVLCVLYFTGLRSPEAGKAELQFPLHRGRYCVFQGGRGWPTNAFHASGGNGVFAVDLVRLFPSGNRARRIFSKRLEDYAIFGDTVFAPCAGRIGRVREDNPDNIPPERVRGPSNLNGLVIETQHSYVFLGHFSLGGVFVEEGDFVQAGQPLGVVGNSGWSLEPHLHIQVHRNSGDGRPWWSEEPMLIRFDGEEYRLFEIITPKETRMVPRH
jgi:hypothetical protein